MNNYIQQGHKGVLGLGNQNLVSKYFCCCIDLRINLCQRCQYEELALLGPYTVITSQNNFTEAQDTHD